MSDDALKKDLTERVEALEKAYEYLLGYAAQGLPASAGQDGEARNWIERALVALDGLAALYGEVLVSDDSAPAVRSFLDVLQRDAEASAAAFGMVLAQEKISSQLVDNLNASIHVRALLTDLFLIDEAHRPVGG